MVDPRSTIPSFNVAIKLASIAVHADELLSPRGSVEFDGSTIRSLLEDDEVVAYLAILGKLSLLPVKRSAR